MCNYYCNLRNVKTSKCRICLSLKAIETHLENVSLKLSLPFIPEGSSLVSLFDCTVLLIYGTRLEIRRLETRKICY